ncbi:MAG: PIG-L family deacetylase [Solirubrobacterales bacterium]
MSMTAILSPHQDDAVFSLWHLLAGAGEVAVVNVFAGVPAADRLGWWDAETGATDPASRARERHGEDRAALALAGRSAINLEFLDAQYRGGDQAVEPIAAAIAAAVPRDALLLAPAGLGAHPDHLLVRSAALAIRGRGRPVGLYADIPHATRHGWPRWVTDGASTDQLDEPARRWVADLDGTGVALDRLAPRVRPLDPDQTARKLGALAEYRTQLPALDAEFSFRARPEVLRFEIVWPL